MSYHGDIALGDTLDFQFNTFRFSTGAPFTLAGTPTLAAYVGNSTTQITAGLTLTVDIDAKTGQHNVRVVATSGNGYATATNVTIVLEAGTVDSVSVANAIVGSFSIENRSALRPTTAGRTLDVTAANKVNGVVLVDTLTTYTGNTAQTGDSFARIGATGSGLTSLASQASVDAVDNFVDTEIADIQARLPAALTGAGNMKSDALAVNGSTSAAALMAILNGATVVYQGTVTGAATTTTLVDSGLTQAADGWWIGRIIIFTSVLTLQAASITGFTAATDTLTFDAVTSAPTGATYIII